MYNNYNTGDVSSHLPSSSATATATPRNPTIPYAFLHHHHPIMIPLSPPPSLPPFSTSGGGGDGGCGFADDDDFPRRDERFPQWSNQETRDFIEIRAQFEWEFTTAKRNKNLWEMVANRMREKGYRRTADQCKCKWKNLVNKYKGQEASDLENGRQCPFFDELHAVFTSRANTMHQSHVDDEAVTTKRGKRLKSFSQDQSHEEEFSEEPENEEDIELDHAGKGKAIPKRKTNKGKRLKLAETESTFPTPSITNNVNKNEAILNGLQEMMRNFIAQQQRIDMQWREAMERRAEERDMFENEWRQKMEKLERERLMMEKAWRERDEQRKSREESRAQKRDALLTTLLNKLLRDESS